MSLTPSQRIKILKEISQRLAEEEWWLIDLHLTQFKLPTSASWSGDKSTYVLEMVQNASDQVLNGLAEHFDLAVVLPGAPTDPLPSFWKHGTLKVFISHLAIHRTFAGELQTHLFKLGMSAFVAHKDITPTSEWQIEIEKGLATCDALVALLHSDFHLSNWTDQEIGFAMGRGVPVFAIRLGQDPYGFIGRFQAFNGIGRTPEALARDLFAAYCRHKQTRTLMPGALVSLLERSSSFDAAKTCTALLEEMESWAPSFTVRIRAAIKNNNQISGSWGVPERLEALIEKRDTVLRKSSFANNDEIHI